MQGIIWQTLKKSLYLACYMAKLQGWRVLILAFFLL